MKTEYKIVLYTLDKSNDALLIKVLMEHYKRIYIVNTITDVSNHLKEETPKVVLIAGEKFQDTLSTYYYALDRVEDSELCEHFVVSLVAKHDETDAYEAYRSGVIDDYMVSRPLYEVHRPIVICEHLLVELGVGKSEKEGLEYIYKQEKYDKRVRSIVAKGLERKEVLRSEFETALTTIEQSLDDAAVKIQKNQTVTLDVDKLKATLASIKSDEIRPELLKLQSKAINLLQKVVSDTNEMFAQAVAEQLKQAQEAAQEAGQEAQTPPEKSFNNLQNSNADVDAKLQQIDKTPRVLLVEDDPISIHLTSQLMSPYKIELDTAFTGRRALACVKSKQYDLVFLDINLPDTNGLYLLDQVITSKIDDKETPVIMLTGNKNKKTALKTIEMGAKGYIVKPMRKENFINIFRKLQLKLVKK